MPRIRPPPPPAPPPAAPCGGGGRFDIAKPLHECLNGPGKWTRRAPNALRTPFPDDRPPPKRAAPSPNTFGAERVQPPVRPTPTAGRRRALCPQPSCRAAAVPLPHVLQQPIASKTRALRGAATSPQAIACVTTHNSMPRPSFCLAASGLSRTVAHRDSSGCRAAQSHEGRRAGGARGEWTTGGRRCVGTANGQTAPATSSTAPAHQPLGSANAETPPARAPAAAADGTQRPDATCEGKNG